MGQTTDELRLENDELKRDTWSRRARSLAFVLASSGTFATAVLAHFRPETAAEQTAQVAAEQFLTIQKDMEAHEEQCLKTIEHATLKAKAEADSVRTLVMGYLLAQRGNSGSPKQLGSLEKVIEQLGEAKARAFSPLLDSAGGTNAAPTNAPATEAQKADTEQFKKRQQTLKRISKGAY